MAEVRAACPLCGRPVRVQDLSRHHIVPRSRGGRDIERICRTCHRQIHALFGNREIEKDLSSLGRLRDHPRMAAYLKWVARRNPDRYYRGRTSRQKRR